jgi:hypothetical protein
MKEPKHISELIKEFIIDLENKQNSIKFGERPNQAIHHGRSGGTLRHPKAKIYANRRI